MEKMLVSGVAADTNIARVAVVGISDQPGRAFDLFSLLSKNNINVDIILQSIGRDGTKDISFTVAKESLSDVKELLEKNLSHLGAAKVEFDSDVAKVSVVGAGMASNPGVATKMFEALYDANINISMISTSEIKISVLVKAEDANDAVNAIHEHFKLSIA